MRHYKHRLIPALKWISCLVPLAMATNLSARAEEASEFQATLTPYAWLAGISGNVTSPLPSSRGQNVNADFGDVLTKLNKIPVMVNGEIRFGRFGIMADVMAISVKSGAETDGPLYSGATATVGQIMVTTMGSYRAIETPENTLDIGIGLRAFWLSTKFELNPGLLQGRSFKSDMSWSNPIIGARYHHNFGSEWGVTAYGDIGGGDHSSLTWQALGTVDYRLSEMVTMRAGYRYLGFRYETLGLSQDMGIGGPILGGTLRF